MGSAAIVARSGVTHVTVLVEEDEPRETIAFRIPRSLIKELRSIAKAEKLSPTQIYEGFLRAGLLDYRQNGLERKTKG